MTDIFLSYNREDQAHAKVFAEAFEAQGFSVWWDVGLKTGEAYDEVTEAALRSAYWPDGTDDHGDRLSCAQSEQ